MEISGRVAVEAQHQTDLLDSLTAYASHVLRPSTDGAKEVDADGDTVVF